VSWFCNGSTFKANLTSPSQSIATRSFDYLGGGEIPRMAMFAFIVLLCVSTTSIQAFAITNGFVINMYLDKSPIITKDWGQFHHRQRQGNIRIASTPTFSATLRRKMASHLIDSIQHNTLALQDAIDEDSGNQTTENVLQDAKIKIEEFASYYREQKIFPEIEFPLFIKSMLESSPIDFRVNPGAQLADVLQEVLESIANTTGSAGSPLVQCRWYPGGLAWRFFPNRSDSDSWESNFLVCLLKSVSSFFVHNIHQFQDFISFYHAFPCSANH
jgi:hypothetical protein